MLPFFISNAAIKSILLIPPIIMELIHYQFMIQFISVEGGKKNADF